MQQLPAGVSTEGLVIAKIDTLSSKMELSGDLGRSLPTPVRALREKLKTLLRPSLEQPANRFDPGSSEIGSGVIREVLECFNLCTRQVIEHAGRLKKGVDPSVFGDQASFYEDMISSQMYECLLQKISEKAQAQTSKRNSRQVSL